MLQFAPKSPPSHSIKISNLAIKRGLGEYDIYVKTLDHRHTRLMYLFITFGSLLMPFLDGSHIDKNLFVAPSAVVIIDFTNSIIYKSAVFYYLSNSGYFKNFYFIFFQPY